MIVRRHASAADYLAAAREALRQRPVVNQFPIAIAETCAREPARYGPDNFFFSAWDAGGDFAGAAIQTAPWPVQISDASADAARALAGAFAELAHPVGAVSGPDTPALAFAAEYAARRGLTHAVEQSLGVFELVAVRPVPAAPGQRVIAGPTHAGVIQAWLEAFHAEATPHDPPVRADAGLRVLASGRAHLWLDAAGAPVSYALNNRLVEGWASIGPVYTPPELRGRGYATALVAAASQDLLDRGCAGCTLFTDLANPTSNAIYERIGYRRIGTARRYAFA